MIGPDGAIGPAILQHAAARCKRQDDHLMLKNQLQLPVCPDPLTFKQGV